jgi:outer membrane immunogenic protein
MGCRGLGLVALVAAAAAFALPARAADLPAPGYYPPPAAYRPAIYDWGGIYLGGHVGAGMLSDTVTETTTTTIGVPMFLPAGSNTDLHPWGVVGGAQAGMNFQWAPWVLGAEATVSASGISGSQWIPATSAALAGNNERSTDNPQWLVTAAARAGYAFNTLLFYVKGGGAWTHVQYTQDVLGPSGVVATNSLVTNRTGFVIGGGIEYAMTENLSAKFEYDFYDFGTANYNFTLVGPITGGAAIETLALPVSIQSNVHVLTVGLNYRFTFAPSGQRLCPTC